MKHLLIIEYEEVDRLDFMRFTHSLELPFTFDMACSVKEAKYLIKKIKFDVIISDFFLGDGTAIEIIDLKIDIPFIVLAKVGSEEEAVNAIKNGASDYVIKDINGNYLKLISTTVSKAYNYFLAEKKLKNHHDNLKLLRKGCTAKLENEIKVRKKAEFDLEQHKIQIEEIVNRRTKVLENQVSEFKSVLKKLKLTIEKLKEQNQEVIIQRNQLEHANKLKSEFLSNMSHELRTPLNSIMALSDVLISESANKLNEEEIKYLNIIERNGEQLLSLINDILDLSKIEAGKMEIYTGYVSVNSLLHTIKEDLRVLTEKKDLSLNVITPKNLPLLETDEMRFHQVLLNIVGNAVKFTETGSVDISANQDSNNIIIAIKDTGIGISEKILPFVFDEFRQVDDVSSRNYQGTGLGLTIANKLILILGGKIYVKSKLNEGTIFTITIPIKRGKRLDLNVGNEEKLKQNKFDEFLKLNENKNVKTKSNTKYNVLIVEDNPDNMITLKAILKDKYNIYEALDGEIGLEIAQALMPDLILLDMSLPKKSGKDVVEALKADEVMWHIPVIAVTAQAMIGDKDKFIKYGCNDYVSKPIDPEIILDILKKWLVE